MHLAESYTFQKPSCTLFSFGHISMSHNVLQLQLGSGSNLPEMMKHLADVTFCWNQDYLTRS